MAEHEKDNFEHELESMFRKLDSEIKIPEIPDAQSIFERAEAPEKKIIPFKKYSKYIAAAAAVVLICVGVPVLADMLESGIIGMDNVASEAVEEPMAMEPQEAYSVTDKVVEEEAEIESFEPENDSDGIEVEAFPEELKDATTSHNAPMSSSMEDGIVLYAKKELYRFFANNSVDNPNTGGSGSDDVKVIEDNINKKRTIEITVEEGSVSVVLHDNSANEEIINAFWVEGLYESSYVQDEFYYISLSKQVYPSELEMDYYLPMAGDANGTYTIPEESIFVPGEVKKGVISLTVAVNIGTGEYSIYASLV